MVLNIITLLSLTVAASGAVWAYDSWLEQPRRIKAGAAAEAPSASLAGIARMLFTVSLLVLLAGGVRQALSESFDFALLLVILAVMSGLVWAFYTWVIRPPLRRALREAGREVAEIREPVLVEYSRTFFPIILIVLVVRSFAYEPFRIPSSSMEPTLLVGDFIFVNKFLYGLRLPVLNTKIMEVGRPERGDVVVFKLPDNPSTNYIKRVVGLPGDRIRYRHKQLYVNDMAMPLGENVTEYVYVDQVGKQEILERRIENLDGVAHDVLHANDSAFFGGRPRAVCEFLAKREFRPLDLGGGSEECLFEVPERHYFMMGDNRDNSRDSRYIGPVPEDRLVGKAVVIWLSWRDFPTTLPVWSRIGDRIQ